ncbi:MAG: AMIN domain-containing protein [Thermodesulfobacteriota bacterium]
MKLTRVLLFLLLGLSIHPTARANATVLFDIEIERAANETKVHLKADGAIKDYRKFQLKKNVEENRPDRMYLDIKNVRLTGPSPVKQVGTALARVRTGRRTDGFRVVFDSNLDELFDYTIREQPDGLLVTIREPSVANAVVADIVPEEESGTEPEEVIPPAMETIYPEPKAEGDLKLLIVTSDSPGHAREWLEAPPASRISLELLKTIKPYQEIYISFLVTGFTPDIDGNFSYEISSFTLVDPSGKPMMNRRRYARADGKAPTHPAFIMAEQELALVLDSSDPIGDYRIIGIVEDQINNKIVRSSTRITLTR